MQIRLTDLANILRAAGLTVIEVNGWQHRGRTTDGGWYTNGRPDHVMVHHTASQTTATNDVNYMTYNSPNRPVANLYIARTGEVHLMAAGPTNTNGSGRDTWGGGVADNNMNRHAIGIEIGNNGVGEQYPWVQQEAVLRTVAALCETYAIPTGKVRGHFEWAPDRKVDPRGPSRWTNGQYTKWNMEAFRYDVSTFVAPPPTPPSITYGVPAMNLYPAGGQRRLLDTRTLGDRAQVGQRINLTIPATATGPATLAFLSITAVDCLGDGYLADSAATSFSNFTNGTGAIASHVVLAVVNNQISFTVEQGRCHLLVDLQAVAN